MIMVSENSEHKKSHVIAYLELGQNHQFPD